VSHPDPTRLRLAIVDYGMGNLRSVRNALRFLGEESTITSDPEALAAADAIVLPGVGAFGEAMGNIRSRRLDSALSRQVLDRQKPILGICLGMQLMAERSEELGDHRGLGWIAGEVKAIPPLPAQRVPHVGWSEVDAPPGEALFERAGTDACFYFDHSFHLECGRDLVSATTRHAFPLVAAVRRGHLFATQFHPEKSQRPGLKLLRAFTEYSRVSSSA
jgi:glutamine amidotransferase